MEFSKGLSLLAGYWALLLAVPPEPQKMRAMEGEGALTIRTGRETGQAKTQPLLPYWPLWDDLRAREER